METTTEWNIDTSIGIYLQLSQLVQACKHAWLEFMELVVLKEARTKGHNTDIRNGESKQEESEQEERDIATFKYISDTCSSCFYHQFHC